MGKKSAHSGHRTRQREKYRQKLKTGKDTLTQEELLELLLFYSVPRRDVMPLARKLLDKFGSITEVVKSGSDGTLSEVNGIGSNSLFLLRLVNECSRRLWLSSGLGAYIANPGDAWRFFLPRFKDANRGVTYALVLDDRRRVLTCEPVNAALDSVLLLTHKYGFGNVILGRSQESGVPMFDDMEIRRYIELCRNLSVANVVLIDVLAIAESGYASMAANNCLEPSSPIREVYRVGRTVKPVPDWSDYRVKTIEHKD